MISLHDLFKRIYDTTSLTREERSLMRAYLETLVKTAPLSSSSIPSPFHSFFSSVRMYNAVAVLLVVVSLGATSFIAEGALPGDTLYALKTGVSERIERAAAFSKEKKARVDIKHIEERLREVELLAVLENTDTRTIEEITADIEARVEETYEKVHELAGEGDVEAADTISSGVASVLSAHRDILEAQGQSAARGEQLLALSKALATQSRAQVQGTEDTAARIAHAREARIVAARKAFADALEEETLRDDVRTELTEEQAKIEVLYNEVTTLLTQERYGEANEIYEHLERRIYLAQALLTSVVYIAEKTNKEAIIQFGKASAHTTTAVAKQAEPESASTSFALDGAALMRMSAPAGDVVAPSASIGNPVLRFIIIDVEMGP